MNLYKLHSNPEQLAHYAETKEIPYFVLKEVENSKNLSVLLWKDRERIERVLAKDPYSAYRYAQIILERFPAGEPVLATDAKWATAYAERVIHGRFPEAENAIKKDPKWAFYYAKDIIKDRWPEAEPYIQPSSYWPWYTEYL